MSVLRCINLLFAMNSAMIHVITVVGFVLFISFFNVSYAKSTRSGCSFRINNDLPEPQPLILNPYEFSRDVRSFFLPEGADGVVTIAMGSLMSLQCPGDNNPFNNTNIGFGLTIATCDYGTTFFIDFYEPYDFSDFACTRYPDITARYSGSRCNNDTKRHIEIGFVDFSRFYKLMDVCFDDVLHTTLYVKAIVVSGIAGFQREFPRPSFIEDNFFSGMSVDYLYTRNRQRQTISGLLNSALLGEKYIHATNDLYLARGQLAAMADFVYGSQQRATFYFVNAAPQWQSFNGGNWKALEESVRAYADRNKLDLEVYTGTYGVATLPNVDGVETELYLYVDANNNKSIPVPKLFWKVVYDPISQAGVVVVGINNPHITSPPADHIICMDVCSKITWLRWNQTNITQGHLYCCDVNDFRSTVQTLPHFRVIGLLTADGDGAGAGAGDGNSSLRLGQYFNLIVLMAGILKFL